MLVAGHPSHFMRYIIYLKGNPAIQGLVRKEFRWLPSHGCYVFLGREINDAEFNEQYDRAFKRYRELYPMVKLMGPDHPVAPPALATPAPIPEAAQPATSAAPPAPAIDLPPSVPSTPMKPAPPRRTRAAVPA